MGQLDHQGTAVSTFGGRDCDLDRLADLPRFSGFGYGLVSYWTAYLKANFPAEYTAALLTSVGDDKDKMGVYLADARPTDALALANGLAIA
ncbi:hypothetical protein [Embleya sp. NPDC005575]|uniref:hypothetical protein n=1 Tax=Embleya sp. NPDC005575 TaxID=3156892 RepID=UPI0033A8A8E1